MKFVRMPAKILKQTIDRLEKSEEEASVMVYKIASDLLEAESKNKKSIIAKRLQFRLKMALFHLHEVRVFIDWNKAILDVDNPNYKQNIQLMLNDLPVNKHPRKTRGRTLKEICQQFYHLDKLERDAVIENLIRTGKIQIEERNKEIVFCSTDVENGAFDQCFDIESP
jgi:hypothetical protein